MEVNEKEYRNFVEWKKTHPPKVWKPKNGEKCWILSSVDRLMVALEIVYDDKIYGGYYGCGLIKQTREEIEFLIEKLRITKELKDFASEHNESIDWNDYYEPKWYIEYRPEKKIIGCEYEGIRSYNTVYFSSKEICIQAIETIGAGRIKKYYLEVE